MVLSIPSSSGRGVPPSTLIDEQTPGRLLRALGGVEHARAVVRKRDAPVADRRRRHELDAAIFAELSHAKSLHAADRFHPGQVATVRRRGRVDRRAAERQTLDRDLRRRAADKAALGRPPDTRSRPRRFQPHPPARRRHANAPDRFRCVAASMRRSSARRSGEISCID